MKLKCDCGGKIEDAQTVEEGFIVPCLKCNKCGKTYFSPDHAKHLIRLRDADQQVQAKRKIVKVGSSIAALLPKKVEAFGITEGDVDTVKVLGPYSLELRFKKKLF